MSSSASLEGTLDHHENLKSPATFGYRERVADGLEGIPFSLAADEAVRATFQKISIASLEKELAHEVKESAAMVMKCLELRRKYTPFERSTPFDPYSSEYAKNVCDPKNPPATPTTTEVLRMRDGVMRVYESQDDLNDENPHFECTPFDKFSRDIQDILTTATHGPCKSLCYKRLDLLEAKFLLHIKLNHDAEFAEQRTVSHRDFYNVRKVDNHVHLASCMNQKHLLRYIKSKAKKEPDTVVKTGPETFTLDQVFKTLDLTPYDLSIDHLDMHADVHTFQRFDRFNLKYNPCGNSLLRDTFLKTDNDIGGRYFAEVVKQVITDLEDSKYQMAEYRASIYGRKPDEWKKLAKWVITHDLFSSNVRWMIQVPRLFNVFRQQKNVRNFQEFLDNLFLPLFEATRNPAAHPELHSFLQHVVAFDSVDDESKPEHKMFRKFPKPSDWDIEKNPPYTYYVYYLWANIHVLNQYRRSKGLNMFAFRPHCGESGDSDHLCAGFLTAQSIAHGLQLRKHPVMEYLFYLTQIGISMSPLSNNKLFLHYQKNPFPKFFARGLNVALSTDDPLQIHFTREPLVEEYSIAAQVFRLSPPDLSEIARNSVLQSGFEAETKAQWLGDQWDLSFTKSNDMQKSNVPTIRLQYREQAMHEEYDFLRQASKEIATPLWSS
eukprot:c10981_g1_i1.p1 GENE.c10981_g1_i1~~c10981_g1_i1.p1  ORF type:complete len:698 (+),score=178.98 c10981_g1_i1:111-2096(+)